MDRINEYHRRFPNQLAAAMLIHTIASVAMNQNTIAPAQSTFRLSKEDRITTLEAELFNLRRGPPAPAGGVRTRNQRAREQEAEADKEIVTPAVRQKPAEVSKPVAPIVPITAKPPVTVTKRGPQVQEEPDHPYHKAKDAAYVPPVNQNVGAPAKPTAQGRPEPVYKSLPPVHDSAIAVDVYKRLMETPITITQRELLSLSPKVRLQVREVTTTKRVPAEHKQNSSAFLVEEEESNKEPPASTFTYQHFSNRVPPEGSTVIPDPIKAYYKLLKPSQEPDLDRLTVAKESTAILSVYALVDSSQKVECTVDPGCQIVAMAESVCHSLRLSYDPQIRLNMKSANGTFNWSLGLARNVSFVIGDITLYFQVHVISSPSYAILLGRPFNALTESVIRNFANEDQTITITDPNSGKQCTIPTFPRGVHMCRQDF